ncbi:MAG: hypothetical protein QG662_2300 [Pseudomonadota bacterium]|nr:hypothetical protein [Pseudomonadota bacterium]
MRTTTILSAFALGAGLVAGGVALSPAFADDDRPARTSERQWLSIPQIHDKLVAAGYRNIEKIEREDGAYEARATHRNGERVKLYLNPQTGDILDRRLGKSSRDGSDSRGYTQGQRNSADCNERRCRDDLPQKTTATPPAGK